MRKSSEFVDNNFMCIINSIFTEKYSNSNQVLISIIKYLQSFIKCKLMVIQ